MNNWMNEWRNEGKNEGRKQRNKKERLDEGEELIKGKAMKIKKRC